MLRDLRLRGDFGLGVGRLRIVIRVSLAPHVVGILVALLQDKASVGRIGRRLAG